MKQLLLFIFLVALAINVYWICSIVLLLLQYFNTFYQIYMKVLDISILRKLLSVSGEKGVDKSPDTMEE